jgi:hypothetical protein
VVILSTFLSLAAGFIVTLLLSFGLLALAARLVPSWADEAGKRLPSYAFVQLGLSFLAAVPGGYVTAWVAQANPLIQVLALGIVVLAVGALSALQSKGKAPVWLLLAQVAISPLGVLAGGLARLRVLGIL